ncbi:MAG: aminomethyl-transferring glycine dehydrogenase [Gammaproteobacteria bacterium]|nr:aminomethyl-transferring glycine dehydrogenase [Gammaproteobacteria bacterium]
MTPLLRPLLDVSDAADFQRRHIGPDVDQQHAMLAALGAADLEQFIAAIVPDSIRLREPLELPAPCSEWAALAELRTLAAQNQAFTSLLGLGYHDTILPPVIQRNVLENPGWYTAYTPYQAEISQGRLEGLLNFQQLVMDLTGMEMANASLLDEATAAAEAMAMARRIGSKHPSNRFFVSAQCLPQTLAVLATRAEYFGIELAIGDPDTGLAAGDYFGALLQYPGRDGAVTDLGPQIEAIHRLGALAIVAADLLSLVLLRSPGSLGADIVLGSSQRFGVPLGFGGPHAAFFAFRETHKRSAPGRIIGVSVDRRGKPALRMALQTREQHIRREKANSNICTSQVLLALLAGFYAVYHGPEGLRRIAERVHGLTNALAAGLRAAGFRLRHETWFDTLAIAVGDRQQAILDRARAARINLRAIGTDAIAVSLDETSAIELVAQLLALFSDALAPDAGAVPAFAARAAGLPAALLRDDPILTHPVFNRYHSETEMLRYLKRLEARDISLAQGMIPLGSCTMKLNATAEMLPITWPEFANLHPFAPLEQARGYRQLFADLERWLAACTGFAAVSLQPNAGSQGEYAGLLAIRRYHASRGEARRDVCLIPASAHGTNPASAQMAGLRVVVVQCDRDGNVDLADLERAITAHRERLAALMLTYPSTHGVFEEAVTDMCERVHAAGGQVYIDGANLNALVGLAAPGAFGGDVAHINLHKTFCIPHGGGGPGMGPIAVRAHLAPFLPGHPVQPIPGTEEAGQGTISAAPWGSAAILPIAWMYIRMMGGPGLRRATQVAILNANYLAHRLAPHFPVLYTGRGGRVAHECIIDIRPLKAATGISEEDIAKRLMDYGFHAPTMSFPVPGTLMIEPTESEAKPELDRFVDAMTRIRAEIARVADGTWPRADNPLVNAPHTQADVVEASWDHPYSRREAVWPAPWLADAKVWPRVNRIDNAHGDRNLVCSCPPLADYEN